MGIGVSYTGFDGATKNFHAESAKDLAQMMPSVGAKIAHRTAVNVPQMRQSPVKAMPKHDSVDGPLIGLAGNDSLEPDGQMRMVGSLGGWRIPITRTEMKVEPSLEMKCNEVTLVKLEYDLIISEAGYVKGRTEERIVWKKSFFVQSNGEEKEEEEGAGGKYGCRAFWGLLSENAEKPQLSSLAFGTDENLDTWDSSTGKFTCNYDESGTLLDDPPVKIVATDTCPHY